MLFFIKAWNQEDGIKLLVYGNRVIRVKNISNDS